MKGGKSDGGVRQIAEHLLGVPLPELVTVDNCCTVGKKIREVIPSIKVLYFYNSDDADLRNAVLKDIKEASLKLPSSKRSPTPFIKSTFGSYHIALVDRTAEFWNNLLAASGGPFKVQLLPLPRLPDIQRGENFGLVTAFAEKFDSPTPDSEEEATADGDTSDEPEDLYDSSDSEYSD
ncbi:hypothetical protein B0H13DRAFT_2367145 [Mycena leptocephala]|nr:hypothetical protein B0H13DRAFT_2367145 [Mycena leptocephala]